MTTKKFIGWAILAIIVVAIIGLFIYITALWFFLVCALAVAGLIGIILFAVNLIED